MGSPSVAPLSTTTPAGDPPAAAPSTPLKPTGDPPAATSSITPTKPAVSATAGNPNEDEEAVDYLYSDSEVEESPVDKPL